MIHPFLTLGLLVAYAAGALLITRWICGLDTVSASSRALRRTVAAGWLFSIGGVVNLTIWWLINFPTKWGENIALTPGAELGPPSWPPAIIGGAALSVGGLLLVVVGLVNRRHAQRTATGPESPRSPSPL